MSRKRRVFDAIEHSSLRLLAQSTVMIIGYFYMETFLTVWSPTRFKFNYSYPFDGGEIRRKALLFCEHISIYYSLAKSERDRERKRNNKPRVKRK